MPFASKPVHESKKKIATKEDSTNTIMRGEQRFRAGSAKRPWRLSERTCDTNAVTGRFSP